VEHDAPTQETPTAQRILAIDDQIAALERVRPKARYLTYGTLLLLAFMFWAVTLVAAGSDAAEGLFRVILAVAIPSVVFALQLGRNTWRRHQLEQELDELIGEPRESSKRKRAGVLPGPQGR
jgi:hypothetical protein